MPAPHRTDPTDASVEGPLGLAPDAFGQVLRERAEALGGVLEVRSHPGAGTTVVGRMLETRR